MLGTDVQYVISFLGRKAGQQEGGYYASRLFQTQTRGIKTSVSHATFVYITSSKFFAWLLFTVPIDGFGSSDHVIWVITIALCLYIFPCSKLRVTNSSIIISQIMMSHRMFWSWIGWQQECKLPSLRNILCTSILKTLEFCPRFLSWYLWSVSIISSPSTIICVYGLHVYWISSVLAIFWFEFEVSRLEHSKIKTLIWDRSLHHWYC